MRQGDVRLLPSRAAQTRARTETPSMVQSHGMESGFTVKGRIPNKRRRRMLWQDRLGDLSDIVFLSDTRCEGHVRQDGQQASPASRAEPRSLEGIVRLQACDNRTFSCRWLSVC